MAAARAHAGGSVTVGVGIPGTLSPATGLVKNANTQVLIGQALDRDLAAVLGQPVRVENDANCFALSEAADGAGAGARCVFGVIVGTGCGGGIVVDGRVLEGRNRIAGEWGHTPLPWPRPAEMPLPRCWCGQHGCLELYLSGPGLARHGGASAPELCGRAAGGDVAAQAALDDHADRLARGLAVITNVLDPDVIVLGGGLSNMAHLYEAVPRRMARYVFSDLRDAGGDGAVGAEPAWRQQRGCVGRLGFGRRGLCPMVTGDGCGFGAFFAWPCKVLGTGRAWAGWGRACAMPWSAWVRVALHRRASLAMTGCVRGCGGQAGGVSRRG